MYHNIILGNPPTVRCSFRSPGERANDNFQMHSVEYSKRVYKAKTNAAVTSNSTL